MTLCLYVCLSITGLRLKNTGLRIVYLPFWHVPLMMPSQWRSRTGRREDETRLSPEIWKTVTNQQGMKDKITVTGDDLCVSTRAIALLADP